MKGTSSRKRTQDSDLRPFPLFLLQTANCPKKSKSKALSVAATDRGHHYHTLTTMTEGGQLTSPLACFIAGALVPITYFYFTKSFKPDGGGIPLGDDDDWDDDSDDGGVGNASSSSWGLKDAPYKMVLCVNQELGMGKGKLL